jgi:hypothetical protein
VTSPYVTQTWVDGAGGGTPVNAARLTHIEAGLSEHETRLAALEYDTGWITITIRTGFAAMATGDTAQIRRRGKLVKLRGGPPPPASPPPTPPTRWPTCPRPSPSPPIPGWAGGSSAGAPCTRC